MQPGVTVFCPKAVLHETFFSARLPFNHFDVRMREQGVLFICSGRGFLVTLNAR
jgi:hypothetical protein